MKIRAFILFLAVFFCCEARAAEKLEMEMRADGIYFNNTNVEVVKKIFKDFKYDNFITKNNKIPPLFLERMPVDFDKIESKNERNKLFIMIMSPLVLKVNEELVFERKDLWDIKKDFDEGKELDENQRKTVENLVQKYDVFSRMKGRSYYADVLEELMLKVNTVPPSIMIAAAVAESNWGTADEVKQGNALYKLKDWYTDKGIKPEGEDDDSYRIREYPDLLSAIRDYALKINSDINFFGLRMARWNIMNRNKTVRGRMMVHSMVVGSPLENYAGLLNYILTFYDLVNVDESSLYSVVEIAETE